jgi:hypothetical protein
MRNGTAAAYDVCMPTKEETAQRLADAHFHLDDGITRIFRVFEPHEDDAGAAVKLLEVNPMTTEVGISPVGFAADPARGVHHRVVEVSPAEHEQLGQGELTLPHGWTVGPELFPHALPLEVGR